MQSLPALSADNVLDVRAIPCEVKHPLVVRTWMDLPAGSFFVLHNSHDPAKLRHQLAAQWPESFTWEYLTQEPENFRVKITKLKPLGAPVVPIAKTCNG